MTTSVSLHPPTTPTSPAGVASSPLPQLLRTPHGLALLELQGTINLPQSSEAGRLIEIGQLVFPDYVEGETKAEEGGWMKKVYMYIGQHQKLFGEVKKLPSAVAVVRRRRRRQDGDGDGDGGKGEEELEVVEIVKWKLVFSGRPEPVTSSGLERERVEERGGGDVEMVG
ncbi:Ctf8-domain-containing protein [Cercophora samala]|uniref:Ctf8-domain-containing protein n=1 Tax=Cercophora samala TaxID=330535 RepID=A0AA40DHC4_9PEZI|nr:Ctf8-domain-containing protein [Cercophora samala]